MFVLAQNHSPSQDFIKKYNLKLFNKTIVHVTMTKTPSAVMRHRDFVEASKYSFCQNCNIPPAKLIINALTECLDSH